MQLYSKASTIYLSYAVINITGQFILLSFKTGKDSPSESCISIKIRSGIGLVRNQFKLWATLPAVPAIFISLSIPLRHIFKFSSAGVSSSIKNTFITADLQGAALL